MAEVAVQHYLNPLTLEAQLFLNSIEMFGKKCNQIDEKLISTLENVVTAIDSFLSQQQPTLIVVTEKTKLITRRELASIERLFYCSQCRMDLGKTVDKATSHLVDKHRVKSRNEVRKEKRKAEQDKRANVVLSLPKKAKALISNDLVKYFGDTIQIAEKLKHIPDYDLIEDELLTLVKPLFQDRPIRLFKFGSRISGIGTQNSDLDIFVDIGNTFKTFENRASSQTLDDLKRVGTALRKSGKSWRQLRIIDNARVPILRVTNARTGIECDIGFSNSLGFCNTKLLEYIFEIQPIARRMCIFLKKWIERAKLGEFITSYSMALMVTFFLQINKHLPAIEQLQSDMSTSVLVGPWVANFRNQTLGELNIQKCEISAEQCKLFLKQFCAYYAEFDFAAYVVCPYLGERVASKDILQKMPERYTNFVQNSGLPKDSSLQLNKNMHVQDPIQLNHNVTKAVTVFQLKQLTDYLRQSAAAFAELK